MPVIMKRLWNRFVAYHKPVEFIVTNKTYLKEEHILASSLLPPMFLEPDHDDIMAPFVDAISRVSSLLLFASRPIY